LGPWAALIGVSLALAIQALFFGDGGIWAFGANCFAMAFALPFCGYSLYALLAKQWGKTPNGRALCAGVGAFVGINLAAVVVAVLLGVQPALFHDPQGHALYFPFGFKVTLPAMLLTHLAIAGPAEAIVTTLVVRYAQTLQIPLYGAHKSSMTKPRSERLWAGLLALVALTPLGLLAQGEAWGEWDAQGVTREIEKQGGVGYTPKGLAQREEQGYKGVAGLEGYAEEKGSWGYLGSGILGVGTIALCVALSGRLLTKEEPRQPPPPSGGGGPPPKPAPHAETNALPDWLARSADALPSDPSPPVNPFLERTLSGLTRAAQRALDTDHWARGQGFLQGLDARAKILSCFVWMGVATTLQHPAPLLALYFLALGIALGTRLNITLLLKRVWGATLFFVAAVALPATLNIVTPGRELVLLWHSPHLAITAPGLLSAGLLMGRVATAMTFASLLVLSTRWNHLFSGLRALHLPRSIATLLSLTYRYLWTLLQSAEEMFIARKSRTVGYPSNASGREFAGMSIAALFGKTLSLAEEVHFALLSRGFTGDFPTLDRPRWRTAESLWLMLSFLTGAAAWHYR
jgi:cobalt/nickel transport system permease protein